MSKKYYFSAVAAATALALSPVNPAWAGGFAISAKSTSSLGNAFSGTTAQVEDASVLYNNPAGMQKLTGTNISANLHTIFPDVKFKDDGSNTSGPDESTAGETKYVPNFYYVQELNPDVRFGLGIYSPFGLGLEYDEDWKGRYFSINSELKTINISPTFSFQAGSKLSLGASLDLQYVEADLSKAVDFGSLCYAYESLGVIGAGTCAGAGMAPQGQDGTHTLKGDNWSVGYSFGLLYDISETTRIGAAFHSATRQDISGDSAFDFGGHANAQAIFGSMFTNSNAAVTLNLPETISFSIAHDLNNKLTLMGDVTWTRWSRYEELSVDFDNNLPTSTEVKNWKDTNRISIGLNYLMSVQWLLRVGYAYEEGPVPTETRDPRVPDGDRNWFTIGTNYKPSDSFSLDLAYAYIDVEDVDSDLTDALGHHLLGGYEETSSYLSVQGNWHF